MCHIQLKYPVWFLNIELQKDINNYQLIDQPTHKINPSIVCFIIMIHKDYFPLPSILLNIICLHSNLSDKVIKFMNWSAIHIKLNFFGKIISI